MEITIKGTEKGIADLVVLLQNQRLVRKPYSDEFAVGAVEDKPEEWRRFEIIDKSKLKELKQLLNKKDIHRDELLLICSTVKLNDGWNQSENT